MANIHERNSSVQIRLNNKDISYRLLLLLLLIVMHTNTSTEFLYIGRLFQTDERARELNDTPSGIMFSLARFFFVNKEMAPKQGNDSQKGEWKDIN